LRARPCKVSGPNLPHDEGSSWESSKRHCCAGNVTICSEESELASDAFSPGTRKAPVVARRTNSGKAGSLFRQAERAVKLAAAEEGGVTFPLSLVGRADQVIE